MDTTRFFTQAELYVADIVKFRTKIAISWTLEPCIENGESRRIEKSYKKFSQSDLFDMSDSTPAVNEIDEEIRMDY